MSDSRSPRRSFLGGLLSSTAATWVAATGLMSGVVAACSPAVPKYGGPRPEPQPDPVVTKYGGPPPPEPQPVVVKYGGPPPDQPPLDPPPAPSTDVDAGAGFADPPPDEPARPVVVKYGGPPPDKPPTKPTTKYGGPPFGH